MAISARISASARASEKSRSEKEHISRDPETTFSKSLRAAHANNQKRLVGCAHHGILANKISQISRFQRKTARTAQLLSTNFDYASARHLHSRLRSSTRNIASAEREQLLLVTRTTQQQSEDSKNHQPNNGLVSVCCWKETLTHRRPGIQSERPLH